MTLADRYENASAIWGLAASRYLERATSSSDFGKLEERAGWHRLAKECSQRAIAYQKVADKLRETEQ